MATSKEGLKELSDSTGAARPPVWLMRPGEVAGILRVDPKTPVRWVRDGRIESTQTKGRQHRFNSNDVIDMLVSQGVPEADAIDMVQRSLRESIAAAEERKRQRRNRA